MQVYACIHDNVYILSDRWRVKESNGVYYDASTSCFMCAPPTLQVMLDAFQWLFSLSNTLHHGRKKWIIFHVIFIFITLSIQLSITCSRRLSTKWRVRKGVSQLISSISKQTGRGPSPCMMHSSREYTSWEGNALTMISCSCILASKSRNGLSSWLSVPRVTTFSSSPKTAAAAYRRPTRRQGGSAIKLLLFFNSMRYFFWEDSNSDRGPNARSFASRDVGQHARSIMSTPARCFSVGLIL